MKQQLGKPVPIENRFRKGLRIGLCFVSALMAAGCQKSGPARTAVQPVSGTLLVNGKPAHQARVFFHTNQLIDGKDLHPMAIVGTDGVFRPTTYNDGDGLPVGDYALTIVWPELKMDSGEQIEGPDRLKGAFDKRDRPVAVVNVKEGPNQLAPIQLSPR